MNAIVEHQPSAAGSMIATPARLLEIAVQGGADLDRLSALMDLQERWQANEARKAWVAAMASFKSQPIAVAKSKTVDFTTSKGRTRYTHATLADVVDAAVSGMGQHGLSHRWDVRQESGRITVSCIITHELGHSESTSLSSGLDDSGNKNPIQMIGSTVTYLQRYTLMSALGLASSDMHDDDGAGSQQGQQKQDLTPRARPAQAETKQANPRQDVPQQEQQQNQGDGLSELAEGQRKVVLASAARAGLNEAELLQRFPSITPANITATLKSLREIAEKAES